MFIIYYKNKPCIYLEIDGFRKKYSSLAYRFGTDDRHVVKEILFVDKNLLQIDGQDYWL
jgi:hypothetical protein